MSKVLLFPHQMHLEQASRATGNHRGPFDSAAHPGRRGLHNADHSVRPLPEHQTSILYAKPYLHLDLAPYNSQPRHPFAVECRPTRACAARLRGYSTLVFGGARLASVMEVESEHYAANQSADAKRQSHDSHVPHLRLRLVRRRLAAAGPCTSIIRVLLS
jgi:hypothetical protein